MVKSIQPTDSYEENAHLKNHLPPVNVEMHRQSYIICNCTEFRQGQKILMRPFQPVPPEEPQGAEGTESIPVTVISETQNIYDDSEHRDGSDPLGSDEVYCQTFVGRGAYWEKYQSALKQCRLKKGKNETVEIRMEFEPDNPRDKNAIRFDALLDGVWHPLGYVGRNKVPKLTTAIKNNELRSTVLTTVRGSYVYPVDKLMWTGYFAVTKLKKICFRKYLLVNLFFADFWQHVGSHAV